MDNILVSKTTVETSVDGSAIVLTSSDQEDVQHVDFLARDKPRCIPALKENLL